MYRAHGGRGGKTVASGPYGGVSPLHPVGAINLAPTHLTCNKMKLTFYHLQGKGHIIHNVNNKEHQLFML